MNRFFPSTRSVNMNIDGSAIDTYLSNIKANEDLILEIKLTFHYDNRIMPGWIAKTYGLHRYTTVGVMKKLETEVDFEGVRQTLYIETDSIAQFNFKDPDFFFSPEIITTSEEFLSGENIGVIKRNAHVGRPRKIEKKLQVFNEQEFQKKVKEKFRGASKKELNIDIEAELIKEEYEKIASKRKALAENATDDQKAHRKLNETADLQKATIIVQKKLKKKKEQERKQNRKIQRKFYRDMTCAEMFNLTGTTKG